MVQPLRNEVGYKGSPFFSYGFRPFFFSAALFAGFAVPLWVLILTGANEMTFHYPPREWHVHEMVFGFLPCVITGFLLTAIPNWTERLPMRGWPLIFLWVLWLVGRVFMAFSWFSPLILALLDSAFLVVVAGIVWREILMAQAWERVPMGVLISLYASANLLFHGLFINGNETVLAERFGLTLIMMLLAIIGGKITPSFTEDYLELRKVRKQPVPFSRFDGLSIFFVALTGILWMVNVNTMVVGEAFIVTGILHLIRLSRWYGWETWGEPLVLILHVGYGWLAMSFLILGGALVGIGMHVEDAIHALTTGAVGVMTLAVMTRASLGHTGRIKHAGFLTVIIYLLVNLGALLRVVAPNVNLFSGSGIIFSAVCWSGAYILFAIGYGHMLFGVSRDE